MSNTGLGSLPFDMLKEIALYLEPSDVSKLCRSSGYFNNVLCGNDEFWMLKFRADFGKPRPSLMMESAQELTPGVSAKKQYRSVFELLKLWKWLSFEKKWHNMTIKTSSLSSDKLESEGLFEPYGILHLDNNKLTSLPESFGNLNSLRFLYLDNNKLTSLPESFGSLNSLRFLHLDNNKLTSLPESFGNLNSLRFLYLDNNKLTSLPESFGNLNLQDLYLDNNKLTSLPESFGNLHLLQTLSLDHTNLKFFPKSFRNLFLLRELSFPEPCANLVVPRKLVFIKSF